MKWYNCILTLVLLAPFTIVYGQTEERLARIQQALSDEKANEAERLFNEDTQLLLKEKDFLNLSYYIPYAGYIQDKKDSSSGLQAMQYWLELILKQSSEHRDKRQAHLESHRYFVSQGDYEMAYQANQTALEHTFLMPDHKPSEWAMIESNLGVIANMMGKPELAKKHTLRAKEGYDTDPDTSPENLFNLLNDLGVRYWYEAKWDSAEYYWLEGIRFLDEMDPNPTNQYYRKAMIEGNLGAIYDVRGNINESIRRVKSSLSNIQHFIHTALDDPKRERAFITLFYSSINLAATYKSIGNYQQALQIHMLTLQEKEKHFPQSHPEIIESWILIGQTHYSLKNPEEAERYLLMGMEALEKSKTPNLVNFADAHYTLAMVYESLGNIEAAKSNYLQAEDKFRSVIGNNYDYAYLGFLANAAEFFSKYDESQLAKEFGSRGLDYITKVNGKNTISGFGQMLNLGRVYYNLGDYDRAGQYAEEGLSILDLIISQAENNLDSIRMEFDKPQAILLSAQSTYALQVDKDRRFLETTLTTLEEASALLEKRKSFLTDSEDLAVLTAQSEELLGFIKKIQKELFELTGEEHYLEALTATQETTVYSRIRRQINQNRQVQFARIPAQVSVQELELKERMNLSMQEGGSLESFLHDHDAWNRFLEQLKVNHPDYYHTKYADVRDQSFTPPGDRQIIRYFFVEDKLFALVVIYGKKKLYPLRFQPENITRLMENWDDPAIVGQLTHQLYQQLWEPFAEMLSDDRVQIIPDGILHNLSFEILTSRPIRNFSEFSKYALLATYDISYHFSLLLLDAPRSEDYKSNYIAFAPGFYDHMKENYLNLVKDTLTLDRTYLSLLPQPFTLELAKRAVSKFGGKSYLLDQSTPEIFKRYASNHKIIHIGTHAESNNISPAYSRLIFAKTSQPDQEDNSLYAYEIYNTDLKAYLTILTACETGKPVYQPGEGMISLAHAFQYAGSESLLTSLWKIDEKSSMEITDYFLEYLKAGNSKDRSLRLAKLKYLSSAGGRTLAPPYWAGLILIGDSDPIRLDRPNYWYLWLFGTILALISLYFFSKNVNKF